MKRNFSLSFDQFVIAILSIAMFLYFYKIFGLNTRFPGDIVDARFNQFILEHVTRWLSGQEKSLTEPPFFYPYTNTYFFSDVHWGTAAFYALPRLIGLNRETAYNIWFFIGQSTSFAAALIVLRRWKFENHEAFIGAFIFAFSLPVVAQNMHPQLTYRFAIPFAIDSFLRMRKTRDTQDGLNFLIWTLLQLILSIYHGLFLILFIGVVFCLDRFQIVKGSMPASAAPHTSLHNRNILVLRLVFLAFLTAIFAIEMTNYVIVGTTYGLARRWDVIIEMVPRLESFLIADRSDLYQSIGRYFETLPQRQEHQLFLGFPNIILFIASYFYIARRETQRFLQRLLTLSTTIVFIITLNIAGYTLYALLTVTAGFNAIRAVSRVYLVLIFPISVLCVITLAALRERRPRLSNFAALAAALMFLIEIATFRYDVVDHADAQDRLKNLKHDLEQVMPKNQRVGLLALTTNDEFLWAHTLDAMLVAQENNLVSLSGYSGNFPREYGMLWACDDAKFYLDTIREKFFQMPVADRPNIDPHSVVIVPPAECPDPLNFP